MAKARLRVGGSFAPPIDNQKLEQYRDIAEQSNNAAVKDEVLKLCDMVEVFQQQTPSGRSGRLHPSGVGVITPLSEEVVETIWDYVPWPHECDGVQRLFDSIPTDQKELRNAAFHLLWFAKELSIDREPITNDKL